MPFFITETYKSCPFCFSSYFTEEEICSLKVNLYDDIEPVYIDRGYRCTKCNTLFDSKFKPYNIKDE